MAFAFFNTAESRAKFLDPIQSINRYPPTRKCA